MASGPPTRPISYVSWILGQTASLLGIVLLLIYGFDLVILQAQRIQSRNLGEVGALAESWIPPIGPPLIGLGLTLVAWLAAHLRSLATPTPVLVGAVLNLIALGLAILALTF